MLIGVIRIDASQVRLMNRSTPAAFEHGAVHSSRVAIELHPDLQPVMKDGGDHGTVSGDGGFLLNQRSQSHCPMHIGLRTQALPFGAKALGKNAAKFAGGRMPRDAIGVWEEVAFEG